MCVSIVHASAYENPQGDIWNTEVCAWVHKRDCREPQCDCQCTSKNVDADANVIVKTKVNMSDCWHGTLYASACKCMRWLVMWHPCLLSDTKEKSKRQRLDEDSTVVERKKTGDEWTSNDDGLACLLQRAGCHVCMLLLGDGCNDNWFDWGWNWLMTWEGPV